MPVILPYNLPATKTLKDENIFVMGHQRAISQDIRPLEILIINLMPDKITTETQLARVLSNTPLQVKLSFLRTGTYLPTHTSKEHMGQFYQTLAQIKNNRYDGIIITGAPVEHLEYEEIEYWAELKEIFEFCRTNAHSTIFLCWAALAGLYYYHGVPKVALPQKLHGVFSHSISRAFSPLLHGFDESFYVPHSRNAGIAKKDVKNVPNLHILAQSDEAGLHLLSTANGREIYVMGHMEYDKDTLWKEYKRDSAAGLKPPLPKGYFIDDCPDKGVHFRWRSHGYLLYSNWLNYYVYQETPYDLKNLEVD